MAGAFQAGAFEADAFQEDAAQPGSASGTGTSNTAATSLQVNAGLASGTGTAYGPTVSFVSSATSGVASGSGSAYGPSASIAPHAGIASGAGSALAPSNVQVQAGLATGTGTAFSAKPNVGTSPAAAAGVGKAYNPFTWTTPGPGLPPVDEDDTGDLTELTDFRLRILGYDFTRKTGWDVNIEESLGGADSMTFTLHDRQIPPGPLPFSDLNGGVGFNLDKADVVAYLVGRPEPLFRGYITLPEGDLPVGMPWPIYKLSAASYEDDAFTKRLIGYPDGYTWGETTEDEPAPTDPWSTPKGSDKSQIQLMFPALYANPVVGGIDVDTFVGEYSTYPYLGEFSGDIRGVLEAWAGTAEKIIAFWIDTLLRLHWVTVPRWYEEPDDSLLERAPADVDNDTPDGITSVGGRKLNWKFAYAQGGGSDTEIYVQGGLGFDYNLGAVRFNGTGWDLDGVPTESPPGRDATKTQISISDDGSIDANGRAAAARRHRHQNDQGVLTILITAGSNERHHPDGYHKGQIVGIKDARLPGNINDRDYIIQRVRVTLVPNNNFRIYDLEVGDSPLGRTSTKRKPPTQEDNKNTPGRLWDIATRIVQPLPGSTVTFVGQLVTEEGKPRRIPNITVCLVLDTWTADLNPKVDAPTTSNTTGLSAASVVSDKYGRWQVDVTFGPEAGYSYRVRPVDC